MNQLQKEKAATLYLFLATLFVAALVVCNLIANKFISIDLGFKTFVISAGVLPYPITFLITDILSEIYGKAKTNKVVLAGFVASVFVLGILWLGNHFNAIEGSPVSDSTFKQAFGNSWRVIASSMAAYLAAQLIDVRIYHFWKKFTNGKHLWLRNNGSTIVSQLVDTTLVILVLFVGVQSASAMFSMIVDGWFFKVICALFDTAFIYPIIYYIRKEFKLAENEEIVD